LPLLTATKDFKEDKTWWYCTGGIRCEKLLL
jgi:predicted sulfurtransferase